MPDQDLKAQQEEVNRLMGRCVLRLQQYEAQLKAILAHYDVSGTLQDFDTVPVARPVGASQWTLGTLIKAFVGSVLVSGEPVAEEEEEEEADDGPPRFRRTLRLGLAEEDFARTQTELRELVQLRNDLIHHFMERHDLWTVEGCRIAQEELAASSNLIGTHVARLREWAADMDRARQEVVEHLRSDTFQNLAIHGILPDGTVDWPASSLVSGFREAARALAGAGGGLVSVAAAGKWLVQKYPDQTPERFGCKTWKHALQESRLFDLRHATKDGRRVICFQERANAKLADAPERAWEVGKGGDWVWKP